jgi:hypothetical protein
MAMLMHRLSSKQKQTSAHRRPSTFSGGSALALAPGLSSIAAYIRFFTAMGFDQRQSALVYYGNRQFSEHLRMTDKALKMFLPKEEFEAEWRPLRNEARDLSHTRNILAHHPRKRLGTAKNGMAFDIFSIHIEPYERILNDDYPGLRGKTELLVEDLRQHDSEVSDLESKLHNFAWRVGGKRASENSSQ